jgi:hypothetical protein
MYKYTIEQFISFSNLIRYNIQWIEWVKKDWFDIKTNRKTKQILNKQNNNKIIYSTMKTIINISSSSSSSRSIKWGSIVFIS